MDRLSLHEGEGEDEGLFHKVLISEPLTFILSPCLRGEAGSLAYEL